jgi:AraC-like DNA-binding protein
MHVRLYTPPPPLSRFVEYLWFQDGAAPPHAMERIVPSGTTELVIALHDTPLQMGRDREGSALEPVGSTVVCGPQSSPFVIDTRAQGRLVGVHFRPGGAYPFFAPPATELCDARVALDDLWGRTAATLRERLVSAPTAAARFVHLEHALLARATRPLARHPAVAHALRALDGAAPAVSVGSLTEEAGLSARRFIELFRREVGLTPKLFARMRRLHTVLRRLQEPAHAPWVDMALEHGYFDQAHLIRDFQRFTGLAPTVYLARRGASLNHIVLPGVG